MVETFRKTNRVHFADHSRSQRVFAFGHAADYALESIAIIAAIASGVALAMVNIVIGQFISLLSDSQSTSGSQPDVLMAAVSKTAYEDRCRRRRDSQNR